MAVPTAPLIVLGHGPVAEAIAMAHAGAVPPWPDGTPTVVLVAPSPDALPFALPLTCPIPELAALPARPDVPQGQPVRNLASPVALAKHPEGFVLTLDDGTTLVGSQLVVASSRWAAKLLPQLGLALPLRPARAHQLTFSGVSLLSAPRAAHLGYGTVAAWPTEAETHLVYDGLADPAQATFTAEPDTRVAAALTRWLAGQVALSDTTSIPAPLITPWLLATTPDYLPVIGPWPGVNGLYVVVALAGWAAALADALASLWLSSLRGQPWPANLAFIGPARFRDGEAKPVLRPTWLVERQTAAVPPHFAEHVRLTGGKTIDLRVGTEVQMIGAGKPVVSAGRVQETGKVIQRASDGAGAVGQFKEKAKPRAAPTRLG